MYEIRGMSVMRYPRDYLIIKSKKPQQRDNVPKCCTQHKVGNLVSLHVMVDCQ